MKKISTTILTLAMASAMANAQVTFKDAFKDQFYVGTALNAWQIDGQNTPALNLANEQYNAIVPENCMKGEVVQPMEGIFNFTDADKFVEWGVNNGKFITGHCLIWHSQPPKWMFRDKDNRRDVTKEELIKRMRDHIYTVVGRYKGRVKGWDVVNEAIEGDGSFRKSPYYNIIGEDFIRLAFQFAHEADPDCELYYNDYGMEGAQKREAVVKLIRSLKAAGCRIDAIGMQSHLALDSNLEEYEKSIKAYAAEGVKVMTTELDITILPWPEGPMGADISTNFAYQEKYNPYAKGLTKDIQKKMDDKWIQVFDIYKRNAKDISRVTFWGVTDADSWKNDFPVKGRSDYPLPFNRDFTAKSWVAKVCK